MKVKVKNIQYDTDGFEVELPSELLIKVPSEYTDVEDIDDFISDEISNITGYCHFGFEVDFLDK